MMLLLILNTTFKFSDVKILFQQALAKVLPEHWKNNIEHVKKVESQSQPNRQYN
jgi:hypothetical protein